MASSLRVMGVLIAIAFFQTQGATLAMAGSVPDNDLDQVAESFDNCTLIANGPNTLGQGNQVDTDLDGYGNACDADYDQDFVVSTPDFTIFINAFLGGEPDPRTDHNGDGATTMIDFRIFLAQFQNLVPLGPSGLTCAGTIPCVPLTAN